MPRIISAAISPPPERPPGLWPPSLSCCHGVCRGHQSRTDRASIHESEITTREPNSVGGAIRGDKGRLTPPPSHPDADVIWSNPCVRTQKLRGSTGATQRPRNLSLRSRDNYPSLRDYRPMPPSATLHALTALFIYLINSYPIALSVAVRALIPTRHCSATPSVCCYPPLRSVFRKPRFRALRTWKRTSSKSGGQGDEPEQTER